MKFFWFCSKGFIRICPALVCFLWSGILVIRAADLYVTTNGTGDGSSWANATNSIQGAIDTISGSYNTNTVWVSNGVYQTSGVTNYPTGTLLTNRVAIYKAITVRSANNDPTNTIIKGAWASDGSTNGPDSVRCVYMFAGSSLIGFTLTNGSTLVSGFGGAGVYAEGIANCLISNCIIVGNAADFVNLTYAGGVRYGTVKNCIVAGNMAQSAGGVYYSKVFDSRILNNSGASYSGGGAGTGCLLSNCTLSGNSGKVGSGGAYQSTLINCTLSNNYGYGGSGGGANACILTNCVLIDNYSLSGGGAAASTLYNCLVAGNSVTGAWNSGGGGTYGGTLYNCTVVSNYTSYTTGGSGGGGGVATGRMYNCIVYFNIAFTNNNCHNMMGATNCCTTPAISGDGNITGNPMFVNTNAGNYRLAEYSPCINTGTNQDWMTNAVDLDGRIRIRYGRVDMGAYEHLYKGTIFSVY
ncbi:MAG: hypothetical protein KKD33_04760 [Verrucomicrobia bacterium]|nr:hypothetical protein [Verrucomicrobiota bacterium]